jgi:CheY-like chemotaxis protein
MSNALAKPKILIADDDPAVIKALSSRCEKMGFAIDTAANGVQMLLKVRRAMPALMIVDVNMPQLDGLTASSRLVEPGGPPIDIIVMTGSTSEETIERCDAMGMFYARKGPEFWEDIRFALTEIFPSMSEEIDGQSGAHAGVGNTVPNRPRVLIVDDEEKVGEFLTSRLNKLGIEALCATNADQAVRIAVRRQPSVIVADYEMPDGDANFLIIRLRSLPETAFVPVIVVSERDVDDRMAMSLKREVLGRSGASKVFRKSFDGSELFEALQEFCAFDPGCNFTP